MLVQAAGSGSSGAAETMGSPMLWTISIAVLVALLVADFVITHKPHEVSMKEAVGWSVFYLALPFVFALFVWLAYSGGQATEFVTGFVVEKSLSVDNLFVFMLILTGFAVPAAVQQRVLLYGIVGALVLRGIFIALGAAMLQAGTWAFLVFGLILFVSALKILVEALKGHQDEKDPSEMRSVKLMRRFTHVTDDYRGTKMVVREAGKRALTPLAIVVVAVFATDIVFAVDSVPAVYGITEDPYLVFATNAFALLGLRALYFVLQAVLAKLIYLNHGLAIILAFIGVKLVLHWAHTVWPAVPTIPTPISLLAIIGILGAVTVLSLRVSKRNENREAADAKA
ncbi:integral membrane protein, TerC family [Prauserella flava]|uniref:TerC family integral membrane protein n=2 Tax=Prauserella salsuginis group TaxID=2893672 RepID=A0A839XLB7_9PSEU|nr:TerC family integral membrane protein [Prauserella sediminis]MCR3720037.1 integral membrane protein, TerC family [Prauserella flava]MCR3736419.1 integral membrane protein, TerC family [Prauserella salsuginis]